MELFTGYIVNDITMAQVREAFPEKIWYGATTCWWTHCEEHLCKSESGLPSDPRGGMLLETSSVEGFLKVAEDEPSKFGEHGLRTFMAGHHINCRVSVEDRRSTCFRSWVEYAKAINRSDRYDREHALPTTLRLFDSAVMHLDPRITPATIVDWDLRDDEHTETLLKAIQGGHVTLQDLNQVFYDGLALTEKVRVAPTTKNKKITYEPPDIGDR